MEVTQIGRRIVLQHWWVIASCVLVAVLGVLIIDGGRATTYTASARLVLDTQDPTTRQEAGAIADTAKAIATSRGQVKGALTKAGARGLDPEKVADADITVTSLGSSGLLQLSVRDRSATRAAAIANALANAVIQTRLESTRGTSRAVLSDLDSRLTALRARITRADAKLAALSAPGSRDAVTRQRQSLVTQEGVLESERVSLLTASAAKPQPAIVSGATPPAHADPSDVPQHVVLGVLLGLILGGGIAALLEVLRPTVVGGDAVAREFEAPLLGTLNASPDSNRDLEDLTRLKSRLALAMGATRVPSVSLLAAGPEVDLRPLAEALEGAPAAPRLVSPIAVGAAVAGSSEAAGAGTEPSHRGLRVHAGATGGIPATNGHPIGGVVLVTPSSMPTSEIVQTSELLRVGSTPLVGVIAYDRARRARQSGGEA
jgi:capsular polysaccharide biosynthesis protein